MTRTFTNLDETCSTVQCYLDVKYGGINKGIWSKGRGNFDTFTGPMLFFGYRPHILIYFDEMLYGSLY